MKLSVVTTLYRSAPFIEEFHRRASEAAQQITDQYELVLVDDGSPDQSLQIALSLARRDPHVRIIELSRNFGHHKALMTGMSYAAGELVFLIDCDLEEPPELLRDFYPQIQAPDCDVVYGFTPRREGGFLKREGGRIGWHLINKLYSIDVPPNHCTVRLMRREYVDALLLHRETNTVIGGLWVITGFHQIGMPVAKLHRAETSYSLARRVSGFVEGLTSFSTVPLTVMVYIGVVISAFSFAIGLLVIAAKVIYHTTEGWASLIVSIWFVGGVIVGCLGVIGLYISRIFLETKNRPYTIVRRVHQFGGARAVQNCTATATPRGPTEK
jgi:putative glycosyltransferase